MTVSVNESGGAIADIVAGGKPYEQRLVRFQEAQAHFERAHALRKEAEADRQAAAELLAQAERDAAEAKAKNERADVYRAALDERNAEIDAWLKRMPD